MLALPAVPQMGTFYVELLEELPFQFPVARTLYTRASKAWGFCFLHIFGDTCCFL